MTKYHPWGSGAIPKDQWIDPSKRYTCNGMQVINLEVDMCYPDGREYVYPVRGEVVSKGGTSDNMARMWSLSGLSDVMDPDGPFNLRVAPG